MGENRQVGYNIGTCQLLEKKLEKKCGTVSNFSSPYEIWAEHSKKKQEQYHEGIRFIDLHC